jgi:hypothetical protein
LLVIESVKRLREISFRALCGPQRRFGYLRDAVWWPTLLVIAPGVELLVRSAGMWRCPSR